MLRRSRSKRSRLKNPPEPVNQALRQLSRPGSRLVTNILRALALLVVIGITVYIYDLHEHIRDFGAYGYPGVFLVALLTNATVFVPAPGVAVVFAMGGILNPLGVAFAAGTGGALGELSGFLAGFSGQAVVERTGLYARIAPYIKRYGGWAILVLAAIPNPFFDVAGIAAGAMKMPLWRFFVFCWIGQVIKMGMFAFAGAYSITWLLGFMR